MVYIHTDRQTDIRTQKTLKRSELLKQEDKDKNLQINYIFHSGESLSPKLLDSPLQYTQFFSFPKMGIISTFYKNYRGTTKTYISARFSLQKEIYCNCTESGIDIHIMGTKEIWN
jgi:hypothetical protein